MLSTPTELRSLTDAEIDVVAGGDLIDTVTNAVDGTVGIVAGAVDGVGDIVGTAAEDLTVTVFGTPIPIPG